MIAVLAEKVVMKTMKKLSQLLLGIRGNSEEQTGEPLGSMYRQLLTIAWPAALEGLLLQVSPRKNRKTPAAQNSQPDVASGLSLTVIFRITTAANSSSRRIAAGISSFRYFRIKFKIMVMAGFLKIKYK